jgi:peptidoglycan hydrolase-like protein with peptidoglycan-binding domain
MYDKAQMNLSIPWIRELQELLNERLQPSPKLRIDGYFGPQTRAAVSLFIAQPRPVERAQSENLSLRAL